MSPVKNGTLELWGGVECTVNRVGGQWFEQLRRTGHEHRIDDLDRFAGLGITSFRMPVLWERVAPRGLSSPDWRWTDERIARLRKLGIRPIVGLLHHGSGPRYTNLLDPEFPEKFAAYARLVAEHYPEADAYTPINEILTTARFSGLYGFWYPHGKSAETFARILLNEVKATVLAMREIRKVNPRAALIQTDDLGKTHSTPPLRYQADFENERRWVGYELLAGKIVPGHPMYEYLTTYAGVTAGDLAWHRDNSCAVDVAGLNYYLSSERYLHDRLDLFPSELHGGNDRDRYIDVIAARIRYEGIAGVETLLREAHDRLQVPCAITELHNGCTREEQMRWFMQVWRGAERAQATGVDVRAITAWSLLGAYDWNVMVTRENDVYEPGVFDIRAREPHATGVAHLIKGLSSDNDFRHPVLDSPGWWERNLRFCYGTATKDSGEIVSANAVKQRTFRKAARPILITGATGTLGRAFARICEHRGLAYQLLTRRQMDIADENSIREALDSFSPWAVINTAGYVRVDDAEIEQDRCWRENVKGPVLLSSACVEDGVKLVTFSSDLVFDGHKSSPYVESDPVRPVNTYGRSKAAAEKQVLRTLPDSLVVRTSAFIGPWDEHNFIVHVLRALAEGREFAAADDCLVSPTYVPDLVQNTLDLLIDGAGGIFHLANAGSISWFDLAREAARRTGLDEGLVAAVKSRDLAAPRPRATVLASERLWIMPSLDDALDKLFAECEYLPRILDQERAA